jgi:TolB-like protein/class 3 adenylate cyclase/tetratricopeptide (TPR) repeat protein
LRQARVQRRLAAILVADMVGYSRLVADDEAGTLRRFKVLLRDAISPRIAAHDGHLVKTTGDGALAEFPSAVEAVRAAIDVQRAVAKAEHKNPPENRIAFRIGVHCGDIVLENRDVFGDAVNVAVRIEPLAESGGVAISHTVLDQIGNRAGLPFEDMGEQMLKNIGRPIRVFRLSAATISRQTAQQAGASGGSSHVHVTPVEKTSASIAVLPFKSHDVAGQDDYFADGIVEDIITSLCHFSALFVIARNTSFTYKGRQVDARRVARELGVRYVVDGSVRRNVNQIRITVEVIDSETARSIWAHRFDSDVTDIFKLQDSITQEIVTSVAPKVRDAEIERARRKPAANLDAYDSYLRALQYRSLQTGEATKESLKFLRRSIELDPHYAPALAQAACCYQKLHDQGYAILDKDDIAEGLRLARSAIHVNPNDALALCQAGHVIASFTGESAEPIELIDRALATNPNLAEAWMRSSWVRISAGRLEEAIEHARQAIKLSPFDPSLFIPLCAQGYASLFLQRYGEAAACAARAILGRNVPEMALRLRVVATAHGGMKDDMREAARDLLSRFPRFRVAEWSRRAYYRNPQQRSIMLDGFRKAGLPE